MPSQCASQDQAWSQHRSGWRMTRYDTVASVAPGCVVPLPRRDHGPPAVRSGTPDEGLHPGCSQAILAKRGLLKRTLTARYGLAWDVAKRRRSIAFCSGVKRAACLASPTTRSQHSRRDSADSGTTDTMNPPSTAPADHAPSLPRNHVSVESRPTKTKLHRRLVRLDGLNYTALSLRPDVSARFATGLFDDTWHILTGNEGARLLARSIWAMAYQRQPRTVLVIDQDFIVPNPFDADPSSPIAIVNSDLAALSGAAVADIRVRLPFQSPSDGTVTLNTHGLDQAVAEGRAFFDREDQAAYRDPQQQRRWIDGADGVVVISAPPPVLREWAVVIHDLGLRDDGGSASEYLDYWTDRRGEVQVIEDFDGLVGRAVNARATLSPKQTSAVTERS
jgi:hypothetical protein